MTQLRIIKGDATSPQAAGPKIIAHICNDLGGWGKGFVLAVSRRWPQPEQEYRDWHRHRSSNDFGLGQVQLVQVQADIWVANMIGQRGIKRGSSGAPIRYDAVERCLATLAGHAVRLGASVHMPRIGCGLAGGRWERIEPLIVAALSDRGIAVTVYDFDRTLPAGSAGKCVDRCPPHGYCLSRRGRHHSGGHHVPRRRDAGILLSRPASAAGGSL